MKIKNDTNNFDVHSTYYCSFKQDFNWNNYDNIYMINDSNTIRINKHKIMKEQKIELIRGMLDWLGFQMCNPDWEYSEKDTEKVVEEIYEAIESDEPEVIAPYILEYIQKNYPFN